MTAIFVVLLSCLACGIAAYPPSTSYLPPVRGRPSVPAVSASAAPTATVPGPSSSYVPSSQRQVGRRPTVLVHGPSTAQRQTVIGVPASAGVKGKRLHSFAPVVGAASVQRLAVLGAPASGSPVSRNPATAPVVQRPIATGVPSRVGGRPYYAGAAARQAPSVGVESTRLVSSGRQLGGHKVAARHGVRTVGSQAPY